VRRQDVGDPSGRDAKVEPDAAVAVRCMTAASDQRGRHGDVDQGAIAAGWNGQHGTQFSRFKALSCHFLSIMCDSREKAKKIRIPEIEIKISDANMRGMLSR